MQHQQQQFLHGICVHIRTNLITKPDLFPFLSTYWIRFRTFDGSIIDMKKRYGFLLLMVLLSACAPQTGTGNGGDSDTSNIKLGAADTLSMPLDTLVTSIVVTDSVAPDSSLRQHIEGAFTVPAAMEVVYGLYDKEFECSNWVCKPLEKKSFAGKADDSGMLHTRAAGVYPSQSKDGKRILMLK